MLAKRYEYNSEKFQYEPARIELQDVKKQIKLSFWMGIFFSFLLLAGCFVMVGSPKKLYLLKTNEYMKSKLKVQLSEFSSLEEKLEKIHGLENNFYRSLLNMASVDAQIWESGTGGKVKGSGNSLPEVKKSKFRLEHLRRKIDLQNKSFKEVFAQATKKQEELQHLPAIKPINSRIVSGFGYRNDPFLRSWHLHTGLDFHAHMYTPVKATGGGRVICAGTSPTGYGYGVQVEIDHGNGYVTKYAHLSQVKVKYGQKVKRGEVIGLTGNTGWSTGPHLHYEVIKNGVKVDPHDYFYTNR